VIICIGNAEGVNAAKESTSTIPIVFAADPHFDFDAYNIIVKSVNWPNANVTGNIWSPSSALANKRFELLSKLVPNAKLVGYLDNLTNSSSRNVYGRDYVTDEGDAITRDLGSHIFATGRSLLVFEEAFTERRIESAFEDMARQGVEMLVVSPDAYLSTYRNRIADLAKRYMIAAITGWRELVPQGGLISYSPVEGFRQAGVYAARILKGAKPGDLPIQHLSKLELFINLKTAKTLGLIVPQELLAIADGVIE
jgi:putative ABC transport system substrate-binding protein